MTIRRWEMSKPIEKPDAGAAKAPSRTRARPQRRTYHVYVVELSPEQVQIVVTAVSGPRLATITWNAAGVDIDRTVLAPPGVPVENILSDMFISLWPPDVVRASLPHNVTLTVDDDGGRTLRRGGRSGPFWSGSPRGEVVQMPGKLLGSRERAWLTESSNRPEASSPGGYGARLRRADLGQEVVDLAFAA